LVKLDVLPAGVAAAASQNCGADTRKDHFKKINRPKKKSALITVMVNRLK